MSEPADYGAELARVNMLEWHAGRNSQIRVSAIMLHINITATPIPGDEKECFLIKNRKELHLSALKSK